MAGFANSPRRFVRMAITCAVLVGMVFALPLSWAGRAAAATSYTWSGQGDGFTFGDAANWNPAGVPANGDSISVARLPGGPAHVEGTPSITLSGVTLGEGGSLYGAGLLTTGQFT